MPNPMVCGFSKHIALFCMTRGTYVYRLAVKLGIDPIELLRMLNEVVPTKQVTVGRRSFRRAGEMSEPGGADELSGLGDRSFHDWPWWRRMYLE